MGIQINLKYHGRERQMELISFNFGALLRKSRASGCRSWESTTVFQISLFVLSERHFVQIWREAPVTHHYSCAYSSPKNFIIKSYPYNFQRTDVT